MVLSLQNARYTLLCETGFAILIFANADDAFFQSSVALAVPSFGGLVDPSPTAPAGTAVDTSRFPAYAGVYDDPHTVGTVTVTASDSALSISIPAADAAGVPYARTLLPVARDNFNVTLDGATLPLTFRTDDSGRYAWLRTQAFVAERVPEGAGVPPG
jgi:hypothetical protein